MAVTAERAPVRSCWWRPAVLTAAIAVGGALAMTVVLGAVALVGSIMRGVPARQAPALLTEDAAFPFFCAAAGVFMALAAGYITARAGGGAPMLQRLASGVLTVAGHAAVAGVLGSPLSPLATVVYVGLMLPAVCAGGYLGSPVALQQRPERSLSKRLSS